MAGIWNAREGLAMFLRKLRAMTDPAYMNAMSRAGTIGMHMVSGIAVGVVFGFFLDKWLGTKPWLTLVFLVVGIIAGFRNVYLDTKRLAASYHGAETAVAEIPPEKVRQAEKDHGQHSSHV